VIGSLRGVVVERNAGSTVLLEVAGVGYLVHVTPRTLAELEPTSHAFMYVHHHIREEHSHWHPRHWAFVGSCNSGSAHPSITDRHRGIG